MALGFIKKVFTFGKEKPAEAPAVPAELTAEEKAAISAESEPKGRDEDLPVADSIKKLEKVHEPKPLKTLKKKK